MAPHHKPLAWLHGEIKTPPFSREARVEAGVLLRRLQRGEALRLPQSRPMPSIGPQVHELRINDQTKTFRIMYHVADDAIVILEVFEKKTRRTSHAVMDNCRKRLRQYRASEQGSE